jgi:endonuclease YncB( thermonuclease family)
MSAIEPIYRYRAEVLDVHDADTYKLRIDLGFRCAVTIQCRLRGVNAPELSTLEGKDARDFVKILLGAPRFDLAMFGGPYNPVVIESYRDQQSFARWVCNVWLSDGRSLADVLIEAGHAVRWP